jgi:hypothetical protein
MSGMKGQAKTLAAPGYHLEAETVFKDWRIVGYTGENEGGGLAG